MSLSPFEPEPTPSRTKPSTNATARKTYAHLAWLRSREKNSSSCHSGVFCFLWAAVTACGPSILRRTALAVLRTSRHVSSSSLSIAGLPVDDRREHSFRRASEDDGRRGILDRMVGAPRERHDRQVGALAGRQGTHLAVDSQGAGRVDRREARAPRPRGAPPGAAPGPGRRRSRPASPRKRRTRASRRASRCRAPPSPLRRAARRAARRRSRAGRSSGGSGRPARRVPPSRAISRVVDLDAVGAEEVGPEHRLERRHRALAGRRHEQRRDPLQRARRRARATRSRSRYSARCVPTGMPSERHQR